MKFIRDILAALVVAVLGTTAALIAHAVNLKSELFVNYLLQLVIAVLILLILGIKSHFDKSNNDQNTLITFFTDELLPNKVKRTLGLESHIVVIEDKGSVSVYESFRRQFPQKTEFVKKHFLADSSNLEDSKTRLEDSLSGAKSVIVVRTKELEKNRWVYDILLTWSTRHSDVPCLILDKIDPLEVEQLKLSPIPEKYYFIPDERAVGWRLLKRANGRGFAWRHQASFNRAAALSLLLILLFGFVFNYLRNSAREKQYGDQLQSQHQNIIDAQKNLLTEINKENTKYWLVRALYDGNARQAKNEIKALTQVEDSALNVSYWFQYNETLYQAGTTEEEQVLTNYPVDQSIKPSVIGCAFAHRNYSVEWDYQTKKTRMVAINQQQIMDDSHCLYDNLPHKNMKSIVCSTYGFDGYPKNTVGICAFTNTEGYVLSISLLQKLLVEKTREFHNAVFPLLDSQKLVPPREEKAWQETFPQPSPAMPMDHGRAAVAK